MEPKKNEKLLLNKEIISNLTENRMSYVKGGKDTDGSGYGMCICNPTDYCCNNASVNGSCPASYPNCGLDTSKFGCGCTK